MAIRDERDVETETDPETERRNFYEDLKHGPTQPPHITAAFCDVCAAIELLEPEQQCRVLNAAASMFGLSGRIYKPINTQ